MRLIWWKKRAFFTVLLTLIASFVLISGVYIYWEDMVTNESFERLDLWSQSNQIKLDKESSIRHEDFKIEYNQSEWDLLVKKLEMTRYFKALNEAYVVKNDYGFDPEYTRELVDYWKSKFDWKAQVDLLNKYPQFKIKFQDVIIHYVRVITNDAKSAATTTTRRRPIPILLADGWPGSFFGFYKMIDFIGTEYKDLSFDIVVPTIPGYGFSSPLDRPVARTETAMLYDALMRYLHGTEINYSVHGEDWGSAIATDMARLFPSRIKALHITMPNTPLKISNPFFVWYSLLGDIWPNSFLTPDELANNFTFSASKTFYILLQRTGYFHLQATRPDTLGHGLSDSPSGLLTYLIEKYSLATFGFNRSAITLGNKNPPFTKDELLCLVTYYWMTNCITPSIRFYRHNILQSFEEWPMDVIADMKISPKVPVAIQYFKNEVWTFPYVLLQRHYLNLKEFRVEKFGGHFAAFENPKASAHHFISFVLKSLKD
jgi:pimeloyl-ACP methyl ester carboxylesterase